MLKVVNNQKGAQNLNILKKLTCILLLLPSTIFGDAKFKEEKITISEGKIKGDKEKLRFVSKEVLGYLNRGNAYDSEAIHDTEFSGIKVSLEDVKETLKYIQKIAEEDLIKGQNRLQSAEFIEKNFTMVRWTADPDGVKKLAPIKPLLNQLPPEQVLVTKYYVKLGQGSIKKTEEKNISLYGLPFDEVGLNLEEGDKKNGTRFRYGKQEILNGILDGAKPLAPTLVYLNRQDMEDALLQGTIVVDLDGVKKYFNVHRNNGIAYDRSKKPFEQERFWYFKEVKSVLGYGKDADNKIAIDSEVAVAGDITYFGLGKVFLISRNEGGETIYRIVILADTGGAFQKNQFQLDWLSGQYKDTADYQQNNKHIADYASVWMMIRKDAK